MSIGCYFIYGLYQARTATVISFWLASNEDNYKAIRHDDWQSVLDKYLVISQSKTGALVTHFNYEGVTPSDTDKLAKYLTTLQQIDPRDYSKAEQFVYWVNLYNALTVSLILTHYPVTSIREIGYPALGQLNTIIGPWDFPLASIANQSLSLNQIEHGILRAIWRDPNVHYVINCASLGCPDLLPHAFTRHNIKEKMIFAAKNFINQPKAVKFIGEKVTLSSIYNWFSDDFGENQRELLAHLRSYAQPKLRHQLHELLLRDEKTTINYQYDWQLNISKKRPAEPNNLINNQSKE